MRGDTGGGNPPLPPNDPDGPIIFNPGDGGANKPSVIFNNNKTRHRGILDISGSGQLITSGGIKFEANSLSDNPRPKSPVLVYDETTNEIRLAKNTFDGTITVEIEGDQQIKGDLSLTGSFDAHRAIIGISGSEKRAFNQGKLNDFFTNPLIEKEKYSLYVRNGATIVGGDIIPDIPLEHSIGTKEFPFKDLHVHRGTIHFYSGSNETSGSTKNEIAKVSVNESTKEIEFKSGSEFNKIRASEINLGSSDAFNGIGSVQIGQSGQGFIAVNAEPGKFSTVLRAESPTSTGDFRMGTITQKGSGSFAILLDADQIRPDAKFGVYSNTAVPGLTTPLITVSESFETRVHNGGLRADNYVILQI